MTDPLSTESDNEREERAFQQAFASVSSSPLPTPPDAELVRRKARTRSRAKVGGAAVAVLLVTGGIVGGTQLIGSDRDNGSPVTTLPAPQDGWRWEFYRDIRTQVPADWDYNDEPGSDWCIDGGSWLPKQPYVALESNNMVTAGIGCVGDAGDELTNEPPTRRWVAHVTLREVEDGHEGTEQVDDWWVVKRVVGHVMVKGVSQDRDQAEQLVSMAERVADDSGGCAPHSPIQDSPYPRPQPAFDVAQLAGVDSITVCQYENLDNPSMAGLAGVRTLSGSDASTELEALRSAPLGGGPNHPADCMDDDPGESAIALRLHTGDKVHTMYVFYSTCHGNGFDDGTNIRELSVDACQPLIERPVVIWSGSSASFERCVEG